MRGKPEKRPDLDSYLSKVREFLKELDTFEKVGAELMEFLTDCGSAYFTYSGPYASPAIHASITYSSLTGRWRGWVQPQELMYYIAPYDEGREKAVIIYSPKEGINMLNLLTDQLTWTGHRLFVVNEGSLPEELSHKLRDERVIEIEEGRWLLDTHLINAYSGSLNPNANKHRAERVLNELRTLSSVVNDLMKTYEMKLMELKDFLNSRILYLTSTPSMHGVMEDLANRLVGKEVKAMKVTPEEARLLEEGKLVILSTDVEDFSMKSVRALNLLKNVEIYELRISTDPITAPIYGLILSGALESIG